MNYSIYTYTKTAEGKNSAAITSYIANTYEDDGRRERIPAWAQLGIRSTKVHPLWLSLALFYRCHSRGRMLCAGEHAVRYRLIHIRAVLYCTLEQYLRKAVQKLFNYMDPSHWLLLQPHLGEDLTPLSKVRYSLWTTFSLSQAQHRL